MSLLYLFLHLHTSVIPRLILPLWYSPHLAYPPLHLSLLLSPTSLQPHPYGTLTHHTFVVF